MTEPRKRSPQSRGTCVFCQKVVAKSAMTRHLDSCEAHAAAQARSPKTASPALHLAVDGRYLPEYWLHLCVGPETTLDDLDCYLRRIWLECCGHMSSFEIEKVHYTAHPDPLGWVPEKSSGVRISQALRPGQECVYRYDFGSTTHLRVRVLNALPRRSGGERIVLLARNIEPEYPCVECGRTPSTQICTECSYVDGGMLCAECAPNHECGEDMQLPVVNSPRTGVCGYTGD